MIDPIFDDGRVTLYVGDCRDLLPKLIERHGVPDHLLTDPPYSERTHRNARTLKGGDGPKALINFASTTFDMIHEVFGSVKQKRWIVSFADHVHAALLEVMPPEGLRHMRTGAWVKPDGTPQLTADRPAQAHESIVCLHTLGESRWNSGGKRGTWTHGVERDIQWHTTPKPVPLLVELLEDFTDEDELVYDPFSGSAAVGVACRIRKRRCVLIELDPKIASLAAQRLREGRARPVATGLPPPKKGQKNQTGFDF